MTGLSPDITSFQAASAFSGVGFTTEEVTEIRPGDILILYGKETRQRELSDRDETNAETHEDAV